jgi:8-oxo-dGTP pyrophosphatase MutT (NUDIX family)
MTAPQKPSWLRAHGATWSRGEARVIYDTAWIRVTEYAAVAPTGRPATYGLVSHKNLAIAVLPLFDDGTTVLVGQHRFAMDEYSWEIPEGGGPQGEDPLASARRELAEETGLQAAEWLEVLRVQLSNSVSDERAIGYIALGLSPAEEPHCADETEAITLARVPFAEAFEAAMAGQLEDVLTVAMLLKAYHMAAKGLLAPALARVMLR